MWSPQSNLIPTLYRIGQQIRLKEELTVTPAQVDSLAAEISIVFKWCSATEFSFLTPAIHTGLMASICLLDCHLQDNKDGPLLLLFRNAIMTPSNLEALIRMTDAKIGVDGVSCYALIFLGRLITMNSSYEMKLRDGSYFISKFLTSCFKALSEEVSSLGTSVHEEGCSCTHEIFKAISSLLPVTTDLPRDLLIQVHHMDWETILEAEDGVCIKDCFGYHRMEVCNDIHRFICVPVFREDQYNADAKVLIKKLGGCWQLFRFVLQDILEGKLLIVRPHDPDDQNISEILLVSSFILRFLNCLADFPNNIEMDILIPRVYDELKLRSSSLYDAVQTTELASSPQKRIELAIESFSADSWRVMNDNNSIEEIDDRWNRFYYYFLEMTDDPSPRTKSKEMRRSIIREGFEDAFGSEEMCAFCFVKESTFCGKLKKCSQCHLTAYCGAICQKKHWREHKKLCQKPAVTENNDADLA
jgi:hypothetical protein